MINKLRNRQEIMQSRQKIDARIRQLEASLKKAKESIRQEAEQYKVSQSDKWEYIIVDDIGGTRLGDLGVSGWELAGIEPYRDYKDLIGPGASIVVRYIFKRKIVAVPSEVMGQITGKYKIKLLEKQIADLEKMRQHLV
ncbi:MAG: hypothetical protein ACYDBJ_19950 [Aggregatilineales bacterium]